ncbi:hypothetical protein ACRAWF_02510 [Streptomyces sp. L7]
MAVFGAGAVGLSAVMAAARRPRPPASSPSTSMPSAPRPGPRDGGDRDVVNGARKGGRVAARLKESNGGPGRDPCAGEQWRSRSAAAGRRLTRRSGDAAAVVGAPAGRHRRHLRRQLPAQRARRPGRGHRGRQRPARLRTDPGRSPPCGAPAVRPDDPASIPSERIRRGAAADAASGKVVKLRCCASPPDSAPATGVGY